MINTERTYHYVGSLLTREGRRGVRTGRRSWRVVWRIMSIVVMFAIIAGIGWWWRQSQVALLRGYETRSLEEFSVRLMPGQPVAIGQKDLGQPPGARSAEERHIELELDAKGSGEILVRNVAHTRKLLLQYEGIETFAERFVIKPGLDSRLYVTGATLTFKNVTDTEFDLEIARAGKPPDRSFHLERRFHYNAAYAESGWQRTFGPASEQQCADLDFMTSRRTEAQAAYAAGRRFFAAAFGQKWEPTEEREIALLGGPADCIEEGRRRIGQIGQLDWRALKIVRHGATFLIAPVNATERNAHPVTFASWQPKDPPDAKAIGLSSVSWQMKDPDYGRLVSLIAGRTTYLITVNKVGEAVRVRFRPTGKVPVFTAVECGGDKPDKDCPTPLDRGPPANKCDEAKDPKCWSWSPLRNVLAAQTSAATGGARRSVAGEEYVLLRLGLCMLALAIGLFLSGAASSMWQGLAAIVGRGNAPSSTKSALWPVFATLTSVTLVLLPDTGLKLYGLQPFDLTVINWCFAGIVLLAGASSIALGLFWIAAITLAALSSMNLAAIALDNDTTQGIAYAIRHKYLFIDLVPPLIVAVASSPVAALRPFVQELVVGTRAKYRLIRWLPALGLIGVFGFWLFRGSQTGIGAFQPAEAGKFAAVLLAASVLLSFDADVRRTAISRDRLRRLAAVGLLLAFFLLLVTVPYLRNDWSPILIMGALMTGLLAAFFIPTCIRIILETWRRRVRRHRIPQAFRPKRKRRLAWWHIAVLVLGLLAASPLYAGWVLGVAFSKVTGLESWPETLHEQLRSLEQDGLRAGRRLVAERIIAWLDLDYEKAEQRYCRIDDGTPASVAAGRRALAPLAMRACYRDIEWQVIRSRKVIADAECGINAPLRAETNVIFRILNGAASALVVPASALRLAMPERAICEPGERSGQSGAQTDALQSEAAVVRPIQIPVVESDFAAAFLIGRFGLGAALLLYLGQILLLAIVLYGFVRVSFTRSGNRIEAGPRRFLAVVIAGAGLLFLMQWMLSWGNVLGLIPVMGQPMTGLSYAISHHVFMALPCLIVIVVGLRYAGTDQSQIIPRGVPRRRRRIRLF